MIKKNTFLYWLIRLCVCLPLLISTADFTPAKASDQPAASAQSWQISADRIDYDQIQDAYTAEGNVTIFRQGRSLTADNVRLNQKSREAFAQGNVRFESGKDAMWGDHLQINLDNETGTLTNGTLFFSENHLYLTGQKIVKTGLQTYRADKARITSCDGPDPDWQLTGRDLKVTIEGYGFAKHTALWAGPVPVLYSPYLAFPVKLRRQSGLLAPEFGYSERKGSHYLQPIYWAINDQSDATLYLQNMTQRGIRAGLEYRYVLSEDALGTAMVDGFQDAQIDNGVGDASKRWGYSDDIPLRLNEDRYWFRMKHNHHFDSDLVAKLDIDLVSDQDYLHEFKSGYNGFEQTQSHFHNTFGRDIDDYNDPVRLNRLNLNRIWHHYSFNTDLIWYDDVVKRRFDEQDLDFYPEASKKNISQPDNTLQQLPAITFDAIKHPLASTPFYYDMTSSYAHFYRIKGTQGHRADLYPRIYYRKYLWNALSIEPSAGVRQTAWQVDRYAENPPNQDRSPLYRTIYDVKLDVNTELYRVYNFSLAGSDRLKHTITPEIIYEFTPDEDQEEFPEFDELDRIERQNEITYGFTNIFTARAPRYIQGQPTTHIYTPFLRFKLSQSFDINKEQESDPEPFSDILAELNLIPERYISLEMDTQWSPYDSRFNSFNSMLSFWDDRGDSLNFEYRFTREDPEDPKRREVESLRLSATAAILTNWHLRVGHEYNFLDDKEIESSAGVGYKTQCWAMDVDYITEEGKASILVMFTLTGLGTFGTGS